MYQFYYAAEEKGRKFPAEGIKRNINNEYEIEAIRPAMWEEHCLECAAPLCFNNCVHYAARTDGRCKRFENGITVFEDKRGCCGQGAHVTFRKWANMMTVLFPTMLSPEEYKKLTKKNQKKGNRFKKIADSKLPTRVKWEGIRIPEFLRRRSLRKGVGNAEIKANAFILHCYSYNEENYRLVMEVYTDHTSVFKTSFNIEKGENLYVLDGDKLTAECFNTDNVVKIYPENDFAAELDILWCDFVKCEKKAIDNADRKPAAKVKCVVWDLDNTFWDGILIETEDPDTLAVKPQVASLVKALDERGIIQSIASKNEYEQAWAVVEKTGLAEYFIYPQIHWNAKSASMESIAKSLNIGIDSLALIDDAVYERNQVSAMLPEVRVYDETEVEKLLSYPEFDVMITEESKNRRLMYKAEEKRNQLLKSADNGDTIAFLKKCNLKIELFTPVDEGDIARCYELVVRTNQLNMSGIKYTEEEFAKVLARENHRNFAFSCKDDFGEYGIVGFGQYRVVENELVFTEFAMSCRVAGKYVESALFSGLLEKENCGKGVFQVIKTKKNILLRNTLEGIGFKATEESGSGVKYEFGGELENREIVEVNYER